MKQDATVDEVLALRAEIGRLRALALTFLDCQTEENAAALRRVLEQSMREDKK